MRTATGLVRITDALVLRARGPTSRTMLRPTVGSWCGPWPCWRAAPRFSRFTQHDVGVEPVMAVKASPRKYEIQPVSLCERVDALHTCQRSVGTKVQAKVRS